MYTLPLPTSTTTAPTINPNSTAPSQVSIPTTLGVGVAGNGIIDIFWYSSQWGPVVSYKIFRNTSNSFSSASLIHTETGTSRQYTDTGLSNGTSYYYWIVTSSITGDSSTVAVQNYPNDGVTTTIVPSGNYSGNMLQLDEWFSFNATSTGSAEVDRLGSFPPQVDPTSTWRMTASDAGSSFVASAVIGGTTVANVAPNNSRLVIVNAGQSVDTTARLAHDANSWTYIVRCYMTSFPGTNGALFNQFGNYTTSVNLPIPYIFVTHTGTVTFQSARRRNASTDTLTSSINLNTSTWYTIACGYDAINDVLFIVIVDSNNTVTRTQSTSGVGPRLYWKFSYMEIANHSSSNNFPGYIDWVALMKGAALQNSDAQWLNNSGASQAFTNLRILPTSEPGPAPFSETLEIFNWDTSLRLTASDNGINYMRCWPLYQWNPTMAAARGRYIWAWSTDHGLNVVPNSVGIRIGYSDDRAIAPSSFSLQFPGVGPWSDGSGNQVTYLETADLFYVPTDSNSRPFYMMAHGPASGSNSRYSGMSLPQETWLFTAADPNGPWTTEGAVVPVKTIGSVKFDHTGYAQMFTPGQLPGMGSTNYHCYHGTGQTIPLPERTCSLSTNPKAFVVDDDFQGIDQAAFAGPDCFSYYPGEIFVVNNIVYCLTMANSPAGRGIYVHQLTVENNRFRLPILPVWPLGSRNSQPYPLIGYYNTVRGMYEDGVLTAYRENGFANASVFGYVPPPPAPLNTLMDYVQTVFDPVAVLSHRPLGVAVTVNSLNFPVITCYHVVMGITYRVYRSVEGGTFYQVGIMGNSINGIHSFIDQTAVVGTRYVYEVRTVNGTIEIPSANVRATPGVVTATASAGSIALSWPASINGGTYNLYLQSGSTPPVQSFYRPGTGPNTNSYTFSNGPDTTIWYFTITEVVSGIESIIGSTNAQAIAAPVPLYSYTPGKSITSLTRASVASQNSSGGAWASVSSGVLRDNHYQLNTNTSTLERSTLIENNRTNNFLNSNTPATQSKSLANGTYICSVYGSGSLAVTGATTGNGTAVAGTPVIFTVTGGPLSVTFTLTGSLNNVMVEGVNQTTDGWSSPTFTSGSTVSRALDNFQDSWGSALPQSMTIYLRFFDMNKNTGGTLFALGSNTAPYVHISPNSGTGYSVTFNNTSSVGSTITAAHNWGDLIEIRAVLNPDGSIIAGASVNGAAEVTHTTTTTQAFPLNWSDTIVRLGTLNGASSPGIAAYTHVFAVAGVQTMAQMKTIAGT
jgi:hypothetical protein